MYDVYNRLRGREKKKKREEEFPNINRKSPPRWPWLLLLRRIFMTRLEKNEDEK